MKRVIAMIGLFIMSLPTMLLMAQDQGTYIDNLGAQDSSYLEEVPLAGAEQASGSNSTVIIIIVAVVVIAAAVFFFMKKKKK
ncbi:LPXTG-motif cell wall anchor domain-containing protein [Draconibacterium orientale]|uniref:LPXTG-motif cell wall anchor domain-containing protein n=2 Tax=Draconibacterium orientale TaxID=1168034 RepID=A0A1H9ZGN5_9BACT|nr:LPXTG cell wall anchor domain-containing protein [Draconibacterium orientale]SES80830.1 LPXTG-motif cell wall anchor domain-containing protein [Draconibacterium orientale]